MKTKFCVFNDRKRPMYLQIQGPNVMGVQLNAQLTIEQQTMKVVDLDIPDGTIPYLKIWETGQALLSYIDPANLPQSEA